MRHTTWMIAAALVVFTSASARAVLLVHEPFNYTAGNLSGQGATNLTGMTGTWAINHINGTPAQVSVHTEGNLSGINFNIASPITPNQFDGTYSNLPHSGGYVGSTPHATDPNFTGATTDHMLMNRPLDPSVTATFTHGTSTWVSYVSARAFNANAMAPRVALGEGTLLNDRGHTASGHAIGVGGGIGGSNFNLTRIHAQYWDDSVTVGTYNVHNANGVQTASTTGAALPAGDTFYWEIGSTSGSSTPTAGSAFANIIIFRIDWSDTGPDVISFARFLESDGPITEAMFNAVALTSAGWTTQPNLDQSQFDTLAIAGARYFLDEIRLGTTFNDVLGQSVEVVPTPAALPMAAMLLAAATMRRRRA